MASAAEIYASAVLLHQVYLRRYATKKVKEMLRLLEAADKDLVRKLRADLAEIASPFSASTLKRKRWKALLQDISAAREAAFQVLKERLEPELNELAGIEAAVEQRLLVTSIPIEVDFAKVSLPAVAAAVESKPFNGLSLGQWWDSVAESDKRRLISAVQMGIVEGEGIDRIVRRVVGSKADNFADGTLSATRGAVEGLVRTSVNHVSNAAREEVWTANSDVIDGLRWTATLDGRTSAVCRGRDGKIYPLDSGPRPPAHWRCRSVMIAVMNGIALVGNRPSVVDTRTREKREVDFRALAKKQGISVAEVRRQWAQKNISQVDGNLNYNDWLRGQNKSFIEEILGKEKAKAFMTGKVRLDQFIDNSGAELSLKELRSMYPEAFV